jgi:hypothetical protein
MRKNIFGGLDYFMYFLVVFFVACFFYFMMFRKRAGLLEGYKVGAGFKKAAKSAKPAKKVAKKPAAKKPAAKKPAAKKAAKKK